VPDVLDRDYKDSVAGGLHNVSTGSHDVHTWWMAPTFDSYLRNLSNLLDPAASTILWAKILVGPSSQGFLCLHVLRRMIVTSEKSGELKRLLWSVRRLLTGSGQWLYWPFQRRIICGSVHGRYDSVRERRIGREVGQHNTEVIWVAEGKWSSARAREVGGNEGNS